MSHALTAFDTLKYANKLEEAGVPEAQAKVQAEAMKEQNDTVQEFIEDKIDNTLATKHDIKGLDVKIAELAVKMKELEIEIKQLGNSLLYKLGGMIVGGVVVLGVLMTALKVF